MPKARSRAAPPSTREDLSPLLSQLLPHTSARNQTQIPSNSRSAAVDFIGRPIQKPGAGWVAYPRCWRSRRTAISSSYLIEQTPTSGCICSSTPTTDARAIPPALPSPAGAVVLARANAALSELVPSESESLRLQIARTARGCRSVRPRRRCLPVLARCSSVVVPSSGCVAMPGMVWAWLGRRVGRSGSLG